MSPALLPALLLLACGGDGDPGPSADGASDAATPDVTEWEYTPDEAAAPTWDQAAAEAALQVAVDEVVGLTAEPVLAGYAAMLDHADEDCPTWYEQDGNVFWYDQCTSDDGTDFDGYGFYQPYVDADLEGNGNPWNGDYFYGVATITAADGQRYHIGGGAVMIAGEDLENEGWRYQSQVQGGFEWTDAGSAAGWLGEGIVADTYLYALEYPTFDGRGLLVDGGVSDPDAALWTGGEATAVLFDYTLLFTETLGAECELEPSGAVQLRDAAGTWWTVAFDTDEEGAIEDDALCDGCGTAFLGSEEVGTACLDFSAWTSWEGTPW